MSINPIRFNSIQFDCQVPTRLLPFQTHQPPTPTSRNAMPLMDAARRVDRDSQDMRTLEHAAPPRSSPPRNRTQHATAGTELNKTGTRPDTKVGCHKCQLHKHKVDRRGVSHDAKYSQHSPAQLPDGPYLNWSHSKGSLTLTSRNIYMNTNMITS